ncbi:hypothetical protein ACHAWF_000599, partial [Thalassiosira exigua]
LRLGRRRRRADGARREARHYFYVVEDGHISFSVDNQHVWSCTRGASFGELALLYNCPRAANCVAVREVHGAAAGYDRPRDEEARADGTANSQFQPYEMARLTELVAEVTFHPEEVLAEEGQPAKQNLYIIRDGEVVVANENGMISNLGLGDYFGEQLLQISRLGQAMPPAAPKLDTTIDFRDLVKFRNLGVGTFGKVRLVRHRKTGVPYTLKMLNKREIIGHHQVEGVIREKNIMTSIDHPFVVNLICTFQDDRHLYMLIELVQGGELFSVIHTETRDGIPNANSRFYAACILESLAHLHHRHITYRDLKPENILIDALGYCVIVDLGFAKI